MTSTSDLFALPPYSLDKNAKGEVLTEILKCLTLHHCNSCAAYSRMMQGYGLDLDSIEDYSQLPFMPVSLFKLLDLKSISDLNVFKTVTSSGTTGQAVSRIFLDKENAAAQQKALVKIVSSYTGETRMPMLIIDSPSVVKDRSYFSVRGAGILGFSIFGVDRVYALDDQMRIDLPAIHAFLERHKNERILLFGFTFMIWQCFYKELLKRGEYLDLSQGILIHGGGWKKLAAEAVSPQEFQHRLTTLCGLFEVHDYYGMVEQGGSIYMQCEHGHLHSSNFSDVIMRRSEDFSICENGEKGIIQVVSVLPKSYPGHCLLTEDEGVVHGEDDCPCGRKGKYFSVLGRLLQAEIRGCSDTYAAQF